MVITLAQVGLNEVEISEEIFEISKVFTPAIKEITCDYLARNQAGRIPKRLNLVLGVEGRIVTETKPKINSLN